MERRLRNAPAHRVVRRKPLRPHHSHRRRRQPDDVVVTGKHAEDYVIEQRDDQIQVGRTTFRPMALPPGGSHKVEITVVMPAQSALTIKTGSADTTAHGPLSGLWVNTGRVTSAPSWSTAPPRCRAARATSPGRAARRRPDQERLGRRERLPLRRPHRLHRFRATSGSSQSVASWPSRRAPATYRSAKPPTTSHSPRAAATSRSTSPTRASTSPRPPAVTSASASRPAPPCGPTSPPCRAASASQT